jgi:hypothetical protein
VRGIRRRFWFCILAGVATIGAVTVLLVNGIAGGSSASESGQHRAAAVPVYHMDTDHATYQSVDAISSTSDLVVVGNVQSQSTEPGDSPGVDALGDPLPAIPHTNYAVTITKVLKGSISVGATVVVSLSGGTTASGRYVLDGGPELHEGDTHLFFLQGNTDGRYYPLAGGAAVADQQPDGSYALPSDAMTGGAPIVFTESAVTASSSGGQSSSTVGSTGNSSSVITATSSVLGSKSTRLVVTMRLGSHQRLSSALTHGLRLRITCSAPCALAGRVRISATAARALKLTHAHRSVIVGSGRASASGILVLQFTNQARRRLIQHAPVRLALTIKAHDTSGNHVTLEGAVSLANKSARLTH